MRRKRLITLAVVIIGAAAAIYAVSLGPKNFAILALSPVVLGFLGCPLMCGVIGGVLWLSNRRSGNKHKMLLDENTAGCCQANDNNSHNQNETNDPNNNTNYSIRQSVINGPKIETGDDMRPDFMAQEQLRKREFKTPSI